ncbi:hypothetical protein A6A04_10835 [Paramagnetospirillum marisnigri]|uniref:Thioredoxin domain-containing protein n=1 Tax=Paramagnetospirillum marisnigri TaxID=1285242 RepID=A0A178MY67_9PROT|nr:redoxin domain-containing protein [Paramagnetospirillum marisnigri]OAN56039.1 hypothetical protein A6A04_10835 [Paramagnetospirillum marisnigri]
MFGLTHAPDFDLPGLAWLNTDAAISLSDLRGRLVILDFWTFCCVNCLHTLPTLRLIEEEFGDEVAVIGIHSPKFDHERGLGALADAIRRHDIRHPVIHDPGSLLWDQYCIRAWPSLVLISPDGMVIGQMAGEPDPEMMLNGVASMLQQFRHEGQLCPTPLPRCQPMPQTEGGALRFPGKIKPCPGEAGARQWAIADGGNHQVVLVDDQGRELQRWGSGTAGFSDGTASASFNSPQGLACDSFAIYVADTGNHTIRRIDRQTSRVTTLAGSGRRGGALWPGANPPGTGLASPWDVEVVHGSLYIANAGSHQILRLDLADESLHLVAGSGGENLLDGMAEDALLAQPSGLALAPDGRSLYLADAESSAIRRIALDGDAEVTTIAGRGLFDFGSDDGPLAEASFQHPLGLALAGDILAVADSYNGAVRLVDLEHGQVRSLSPICTDAACRPWSEPAGIAADGPDRLLLSDTNNHRIVEIDLATGRSRTWME